MRRQPPGSTRTDTLFPYTTLFRSFPHLAMIAMVENHVEREGRKSSERRYYLSSVKLDAQAFAAAVRAHWGIENRLHWVLDVVFHDDLTRQIGRASCRERVCQYV